MSEWFQDHPLLVWVSGTAFSLFGVVANTVLLLWVHLGGGWPQLVLDIGCLILCLFSLALNLVSLYYRARVYRLRQELRDVMVADGHAAERDRRIGFWDRRTVLDRQLAASRGGWPVR